MFACLYLFFSGLHSGVQMRLGGEDMNIVKYLGKKFDIKQEFFESLHSFFLNDDHTYTGVMIKFMRRLQASFFERDNAGIQVPL